MFSNLVNSLRSSRPAAKPAQSASTATTATRPASVPTVTPRPTQTNQQPEQSSPASQPRAFSAQDRSILSMSGLRIDTTSSRWSVKNNSGQLVSKDQATDTLRNSPFTIINKSIAILDKKVDSVIEDIQSVRDDFRKFVDKWLLDKIESDLEKKKKEEKTQTEAIKPAGPENMLYFATLAAGLFNLIKNNKETATLVANTILPVKMLLTKEFAKLQGLTKSIGDNVSRIGKSVGQSFASGTRKLFGGAESEIEEFVDKNGKKGFRNIKTGQYVRAPVQTIGSRIAQTAVRAGSSVVEGTAQGIGKVATKLSAAAIKALSVLKPFVKVIRVVPILAPFVSFLDTVIALRASGGEWNNEVSKAFSKNLGGFLGGALGAVIFGFLGSFIPFIGTIVFGIAGALLGATLGEFLGEKLAPWFLGEKTASQVLKEIRDETWPMLKNKWNTLSSMAGNIAAFFGFGKKEEDKGSQGNTAPTPTDKPSPLGTGTPRTPGKFGTGPSVNTFPGNQNVSDLPINYSEYTKKLAERESGNDYNKINTIGYLGKYQFGASALQDLGLVKKGTSQKNLKNSENWTIGGGREGFLKDHQLQEEVMVKYTKQNYNTLKRMKIITDDMSNQDVAGYLAAAHLVGPGGAKDLKKGKVRTDDYGTTAASYFKLGASTQTTSAPVAVASAAPQTSPEMQIEEVVVAATREKNIPTPPPVPVASSAPALGPAASTSVPTPRQQPNRQVASVEQRNYAMSPSAPSSPEDHYAVYFGTSLPNVSSPSLYG